MVNVVNHAYKPSMKVQCSRKIVETLASVIKTIKSKHATKNVFFFKCFSSVLLSAMVSVLITRNVKNVAHSSPNVLNANIAIGIPSRQVMMVTPCPRDVLGVICP